MTANDFARKLGIRAGQRIYLVDNKTLTFDGVEYGIRFVVRRELR
jgi:hypothetical protein